MENQYRCQVVEPSVSDERHVARYRRELKRDHPLHVERGEYKERREVAEQIAFIYVRPLSFYEVIVLCSPGQMELQVCGSLWPITRSKLNISGPFRAAIEFRI